MMLEKPNKYNKYLVKYKIFGFTLQNPLLQRVKWILKSKSENLVFYQIFVIFIWFFQHHVSASGNSFCYCKKTNQALNRDLNIFIDPSFQGVNRLALLQFEGDEGQKSYKQYYLPTVEIKDYNVMINGRNFFDQPIKNVNKK